MANITHGEIHEIQGRILRELLFHPERKFSELNTGGVPSDQFSFHVKRLVELDLLRKVDDHYELTPIGKEFANRFDTDAPVLAIERQAKLGALVCCVRGEGASGEYLLQQRLKQPYYGFWGFVGGKIRWGEVLPEAATRELKEETGLLATLTLAGIEHKMDYHKATGELAEDKFFLFFRGEDAHGALIETFEGGKNAWLTRAQIEKLPDLFHDVLEGLDLIDSKEFRLIERKYSVEKY